VSGCGWLCLFAEKKYFTFSHKERIHIFHKTTETLINSITNQTVRYLPVTIPVWLPNTPIVSLSSVSPRMLLLLPLMSPLRPRYASVTSPVGLRLGYVNAPIPYKSPIPLQLLRYELRNGPNGFLSYPGSLHKWS